MDIKNDKKSTDEGSDNAKTQEGDISSIQPLEDDEEEVKYGKRIKRTKTKNKLETKSKQTINYCQY